MTAGDMAMIQVVRTIALPFIVFLVVAIAAKQIHRAYRHWKYGEGQPEILVRDILFFTGLSFLLFVPATAGIFGIVLGTVPAWIAISSTVGVCLLVMMAVYEYKVIGSPPREGE